MTFYWSFESEYGKHCNTILRTQWSHKDGRNNAQHWVSIPCSYSGEMIWNRLWHSVTSLRTMADMYTLQLPLTVLTKLHNEHASFTYCQLLVRCNVHPGPHIHNLHHPLPCTSTHWCTSHSLQLTDLYDLSDLYISLSITYWLVHLTQWLVHIILFYLLTCTSHCWLTSMICTYQYLLSTDLCISLLDDLCDLYIPLWSLKAIVRCTSH